MSDLIKIAVDAMGGDGSPKKILDGIILNHSKNKNNFFKIFGDKNKIDQIIDGKIPKEFFEIIHTEKKIESTDSPLEGAKRGKDTSMWLAIQSVKNKEADIVISAGNTGALLVVFSALQREIWQWHWYAYGSGACIFLYSVVGSSIFTFTLNIAGSDRLLLALHITLLSLGLSTMCGAVSYLSAYEFVASIFRNKKYD